MEIFSELMEVEDRQSQASIEMFKLSHQLKATSATKWQETRIVHT